MEFFSWLQDMSAHLAVARQRKRLRRPGRGVDYQASEMLGALERTVEALHPRAMQLEVTHVSDQTDGAKTFSLRRTDGPLPPFRAGQYISLQVTIDQVRTNRPYSIASPPGADELELTVGDKPDGFVAPHLLANLKPGDQVTASGPAGHFYYEPLIDGQDLVFLAGGSGITPFMSMAQDLLAHQPEVRIHLIHGSRTPQGAIYARRLQGLAQEHSAFTYWPVISEPPDGYPGHTGFMDAALLTRLLGSATGKTFYLCGPAAMYDFCLKALAELGVPGRRIRREVYGPPADITAQPGWPEGLPADRKFRVTIDGRGEIEAMAGEPLLVAMERAGVEAPALCRSGECSLCRVRLLAGQVYSAPGAALRECDHQYGYIHGCVSYPLGDLRIRW